MLYYCNTTRWALPVINGVITPINGLINGYITVLITLVIGVINPDITGRGPTLCRGKYIASHCHKRVGGSWHKRT